MGKPGSHWKRDSRSRFGGENVQFRVKEKSDNHVNAVSEKTEYIKKREIESYTALSDLHFKIDETSSYLKVEGKKSVDREQLEVMELAVRSTNNKILTMVRRESCLRKKQNGVRVRRKHVAELLPTFADFPVLLEVSPFTGMVRRKISTW